MKDLIEKKKLFKKKSSEKESLQKEVENNLIYGYEGGGTGGSPSIPC